MIHDFNERRFADALAARTPAMILRNARAAIRDAVTESGRKPAPVMNWVLAMRIYGFGQGYSQHLCRINGIDPDAYNI